MSPNPAPCGDARLLQLWHSYEEASFLLDAVDDAPPQEAARIAARREVARALIRGTTPETFAGLAIKLRMLGEEMLPERDAWGPGEKLLAAVMADADRLADAAAGNAAA